MKGVFPRLKKIWADGGYRGELVGWVKANFNWILELVEKPRSRRRLSKEYEYLYPEERYGHQPGSSEAFIYVAMIRLMTRRLATEGA